jgi:tetratricopeptide (TPR) repeat protein
LKTAAATICLLLAAAMAAPEALSQPRAAKSPRLREARVHAQRAVIHYELGRYAAALDEYGRAYDLAPVPELLFNMGQCHFQLRSYQQAILFYQAYLADLPDAKNRQLALDLMAEASGEIEQQRSEILVRTSSPSRRAERPVYRRWWFWAAVGTAAIAAVGTTIHFTGAGEPALPARSLGAVDAR